MTQQEFPSMNDKLLTVFILPTKMKLKSQKNIFVQTSFVT